MTVLGCSVSTGERRTLWRAEAGPHSTWQPFRASRLNDIASSHPVSAESESAASCRLDCDSLLIQEVAFITSVLRDLQEQRHSPLCVSKVSDTCQEQGRLSRTILSTSPGYPTLSSLARVIYSTSVLLPAGYLWARSDGPPRDRLRFIWCLCWT